MTETFYGYLGLIATLSFMATVMAGLVVVFLGFGWLLDRAAASVVWRLPKTREALRVRNEYCRQVVPTASK